ncbi:protein kinase domain-containing protein [Succinimonas sp.]|uniref:protein kinase domain-containing protein n=1 Tax=Succinimonas sp. TaxID=1936151 RepID=UPI0038687341
MSETKVNATLFSKFKKTQVRKSEKLPDITGLTLGEFHADSRLDIVSGEADIYLCSGTGSRSGKKFLLKYYRRENAVKPDVLEKLKTVTSPFVASVAGFGSYMGHQYAARPYYEMSTLAELLSEGVRFSEEELRTLIIPSVTEGLKAVHDAGILYKDLKPANLIPDDTWEHIVLIDFGISSHAGKNTFVVTETGMTLCYAAPEALQGIFHRETDYYALGITVFELFTGFTPFQNPDLSPETAARLAAISKIEFPEDFPEGLKKLVKGLTYKDISHRNEQGNPNRRWGYHEVRRWLNGEDVPVPGECEDAFPPYKFGGVFHKTQESLVKALLKDPASGIWEAERGILTHHFSLFAPDLESISREAETNLRKGINLVSRYQIFYRLMYRLAPELKTIFCGGQEFGSLTELGEAAVTSAVTQNTAFARGFRLLQSSFLDFYAENVLKSAAASDILRKTDKILSLREWSDVQIAWILGYALSKKRNLRIGDKNFSSPGKLLKYLRKLEKEQGFAGYFKYAEEHRKELEFFAAVIPEARAKQALKLVLKDLANGAVFGRGELYFKNATAFDYYVGKLLRDKDTASLRRLCNSYGPALREISEEVWQSSSYENLRRTVSGFPMVRRRSRSRSDAEMPKTITVNGIIYPAALRVKAGDYFRFGSYPQNIGCEKEPIEWLVLEVKGNEALLVSRYGLDCKQYHHEKTVTSWQNCDLRKWLNSDFLETAFTKEEQWRIGLSEVPNGGESEDVSSSDDITRDRVFCLSCAEAENYFKNVAERQCQPTEYACRQGACINSTNGCCYWWLRAPLPSPECAPRVFSNGYLDSYFDSSGGRINFHDTVRPALWLIWNL